MLAGDSQTLRNKRHFVISVIAINVFTCIQLSKCLSWSMMWKQWLITSDVRMLRWLSVVMPFGRNDSRGVEGEPEYLKRSLPATLTTTTARAFRVRTRRIERLTLVFILYCLLLCESTVMHDFCLFIIFSIQDNQEVIRGLLHRQRGVHPGSLISLCICVSLTITKFIVLSS